jgi:hypothetical protein
MAHVNTLGPDYLDDATLASMTDRAYREAARSYAEARTAPASIRAMLTASATDAQMYWIALRDEQDRRNGSARPWGQNA